MKALAICLGSLLNILLSAAPAGALEKGEPKPPNILLILADDLGFSDLGCYGGEIATPNLDRVARSGLRFTQFYNTARCWPTRASLMTGYYAQQVRRDKIPGVPKTGGGGTRPDWAPLLPKLLKPAGYRSYHTGKWHIDGMPIAEGFDRSYYLKDQGRFFNPKTHWLDDKPLPPVEKGSDFYATTRLADHVIETLKDHASNHGDRPFFHYLAFAAPHFPLHALPEDIEKYKDRYSVGWGEVRAERFARMKSLGLDVGDLSKVERDLGPPYSFGKKLDVLGLGETILPARWDSLTETQKEFQASKMEIHAAMIDRMDQEIGRVIKQIETMGQLENTVIVFLSDNGASAEIMVRDDGHDPKAAMGSAETYLCLGPGWSTTCNTPFRRHKTWTHEGGISTPLIVSWPAGIKARGELRKGVGHVIDIVPTILELAGEGAQIPEKPAAVRPGNSLLPMLEKDVNIKRESLWWFHDGHRAIRVGNSKLVSAKGEPWELFDLSSDRAESTDLSKKQAEKVLQLEAEWNRQLAEFTEMAKRK